MCGNGFLAGSGRQTYAPGTPGLRSLLELALPGQLVGGSLLMSNFHFEKIAIDKFPGDPGKHSPATLQMGPPQGVFSIRLNASLSQTSSANYGKGNFKR